MNKGRKYFDNRTKSRSKQEIGYIREYAYDKEGNAVLMDGTKVGPGIPFEKNLQQYRDRPNRKTKRAAYSHMKGK